MNDVATYTVYACQTDFMHEMDACPTKVFPTVEMLKKHYPCVEQCGIVELEVKYVRTVQESNYGE